MFALTGCIPLCRSFPSHVQDFVMHLVRALILLCLTALASLPAWAQEAKPRVAKRVALLIGNADYKYESKLKNPRNDANLLANVLKRELAFDTVEVKHDLDASEMRAAVVRFANQAKGADVVLFYFSGHGIRAARRNILLSTKANTGNAPLEEWELHGMPADEISDKLKDAGARITLLVLDACREGPGQGKSAYKGLLTTGGGQSLLIAYAASDGQLAQDGIGANSPYAAALAKALRRNDLSLLAQLDQVAREVKAEMALLKHKQHPTRDGNLPIDEFLRPEEKPAPPKTPDQEEAAWQVCINGKTEQPCVEYEQDFPKGPRIKQVKVRIADFQRAAQTRVVDNGVKALPAMTPMPAPKPLQAGQVIKDCDICPELVVIQGGEFIMGEYTKSGEKSEEPSHSVKLGSFLLGRFEVTQGQWRALMGNNPSGFNNCGDDCPVENVSWNDTQAYLKKLKEKTGQAYRLPSEAEWEYAARAGSSTAWHFGYSSSQLERYAWYGDNAGVKTHVVGGKQANEWGLHDMHGNVWEWVEDCWHANYWGAPADGEAWLRNCLGETRVLRGGSWDLSAIYSRAAKRDHYTPSKRLINLGFRVARTPR
ncbi:SUMF1/EgtB/PvdO family nonheme iron enzyme [Massilia sp. W12]|uniref:SUMF1/EgtB/PvdO family nonheme iron enzyme n=1 Tax=Massilia sp. W12 TaxID=3126507 RepID=UPI0030D12F12